MRTLVRILEQPSAAEALRLGSRRVTYGQLARRAAAFADELRRRELDEGGRIALHLPPCVDAPAVLLGCWMAGAVAVPLDPGLDTDRVELALRRAGAQLLVSHGTGGASLSRRLDWQDRTLLTQAPSSWAGDRLRGVFRRGPTALDARRWSPDEPCLLLFVPGERLQGRLITAATVDAFTSFWRDELAMGTKDRVAWTAFLPSGSGRSDALVALSAGATLLPAPSTREAAWVHSREVTVWSSRPRRVLDMLANGLCDPEPPGDLRCLLCVGEPLDGADAVDLVRTLPWCRIWTVTSGVNDRAAEGYEVPDWFDPADPPAPRALHSLLDGSLPEIRPGLQDSA
jgi:non-ribosomal peptide synthetase component F